jgi:hypothetical protein
VKASVEIPTNLILKILPRSILDILYRDREKIIRCLEIPPSPLVDCPRRDYTGPADRLAVGFPSCRLFLVSSVRVVGLSKLPIFWLRKTNALSRSTSHAIYIMVRVLSEICFYKTSHIGQLSNNSDTSYHY